MTLLNMLSKFRKDDRAAISLYFAILVPVLFGVIGLALEGGRYLNLNSQLQELADASSLAGAKELDGASDSITRATAKAQSLLTNDTKWSDLNVAGVQITTPVFYADVAALASNTTTTNAKVATIIKVTTINRSVTAGFLKAVNGGNQATLASAAAKSTFVYCKPIQSFMCNPAENLGGNTPGLSTNFLSSVPIGAQVHLLAKTGGNAWGSPGDWGLLDPPSGSQNPHDLPAFWAGTAAPSCRSNTVNSPLPGNKVKFAQPGMNTRFDSPTDDSTLSAPIVVNGYQTKGNNLSCTQYGATDNTWTLTTGQNQGAAGGTVTVGGTAYGFKQTDAGSGATAYQNYINYCSAGTPVGSCPLPRDRALTSGVNFGTGVNIADLQAYWLNHHTGTLPAGFTTRYKVYQAEVTETYGTNTTGAGNWTRTAPFEPYKPGITTAPKSCSSATISSPIDMERRNFWVGVADCSYYSINGNSNDLPQNILAAKFFMTESALSDGSMYAELLEIKRANEEGSPIHQIVELVR